jgi:hypothetical protein
MTNVSSNDSFQHCATAIDSSTAQEVIDWEEPRVLADLKEFVAGHRPHGQLLANAGAPTPNGYRG